MKSSNACSIGWRPPPPPPRGLTDKPARLAPDRLSTPFLFFRVRGGVLSPLPLLVHIVAFCGRPLQEAARQDPDNAEYRTLIKKFKRMESTKEAGNQAFKANDFAGAVKSWSEALAVDKTNKSFNSKLHCNLAVAYAKVT